MLEISFIFECERCGKKRCCNIDGYVRTCAYCHLQWFLCQSEISCNQIVIEGKCEDCAGQTKNILFQGREQFENILLLHEAKMYGSTSKLQ